MCERGGGTVDVGGEHNEGGPPGELRSEVEVEEEDGNDGAQDHRAARGEVLEYVVAVLDDDGHHQTARSVEHDQAVGVRIEAREWPARRLLVMAQQGKGQQQGQGQGKGS